MTSIHPIGGEEASPEAQAALDAMTIAISLVHNALSVELDDDLAPYLESRTADP